MPSNVSPERIAGHDVLFVMAAEAEYGPALRARISPLMTGVGPVESAVVLAAYLARIKNLPDLVVSLGSAGSARLPQGAVFQAGSVAYRDMDASALGFPRGQTPFLDLPPVVHLPLRLPDVPVASLSTGADIVSGPAAYARIAEDMVDMESWAVLRACQHFRLPMIGLRGISDGAAELSHIGDWTQYLHHIDQRLAATLDGLEDGLRGGMLSASATPRPA
ncbi:5'-methylthioadenosine/S-adenosylhomocysteine nucleosidase [Paracoccus pacificus]|uniref:5'-methylthioadenosine/S-adenosylhomocysteine nucleosidase n=1 Tax=Paracoccus pacificus TaxID=1463598 RepID=A0ABW4RC11_9RHOB